MSLSEKRVFYPQGFFYHEEDVKEFIKELKNSKVFLENDMTMWNAGAFAVIKNIDEEAGDKLT